jgi:hypothetical protein
MPLMMKVQLAVAEVKADLLKNVKIRTVWLKLIKRSRISVGKKDKE